MPIERIQIIITEEGGRRVKASIDDIGKSGAASASGVQQLKTALGQIGAASAGVGAATAQIDKLSAAMAQITSVHGGLGATITGTTAAVNTLAVAYEKLSAAEQLAAAQAAALRAATGFGMVTAAQEQVLAQAELADRTAQANAQMKLMTSTQAGLGAVIAGTSGAIQAQAVAWGNLSAAQQLSAAQASALRASTGYAAVSAVEAEVLAQQELAVAVAASNAQLQNIAATHGGTAASISGVTTALHAQTVAWGQLTAAQQLASAQAATLAASAGYGMATEAQQAMLVEQQMGQARMRLMAALPGQYRAVGTAASVAAKEVETVAEANMRAARTFGVLGNRLFSIKTILGVLLVREVVNLTNSYQSLQNRLRVVTDGEGQLAKTTKDLYDVAQRTRVGFEDTAETYARMAFNTRHLGLSQRELMQITETLNMALVVGGAKAQEGSNALIQLSQAFATGRLRADEFRAVTEQLPVVADAIAHHFKVNRGELLKLSIEGKITIKEMLEAFKEAAPEIQARFGKTIPTIEQSFVRLKNAMMLILGEIGQSSGATTTLSSAVSALIGNLDRLKGILQTIMLAFTIFVGVRGIQLLMHLVIVLGSNIMLTSLRVADLIAKIKMLTTTLEGVFILRAGIAAALAPLALLAETLAVMAAIGVIAIGIKLTIEEPKGMGKAILAFLMNNPVGNPLRAIGAAGLAYDLEKANTELTKMSDIIDNFPELPKLELDMILPDLGKSIEKLDREYELLRMGNVERRVATELDKIRADLEPANRQLNKVEEAALRSRILKVIGQEELNNIIDQKKTLEENLQILQLTGDARERESQLAQILKNTDLGVSAELRKQLLELIQQTIVLERRDKLSKALEDLRQENIVLKANRHEREVVEDLLNIQNTLQAPMLPLQAALLMMFLQQNKALRDKNKLFEEIVGPDDEVLQRTQLLGELLKDGVINLEQYGSEMRKTFQVEASSDKIIALVKHLDELHHLFQTGNLRINDYRDALADAFGIDTVSMQIRRIYLQFEGFDTLLAHGAITVNEYRLAIRDLQIQLERLRNVDRSEAGQFLHGFVNGLRVVIADASNFGQTIEEWVVGSFQRASDAIVEFAQHGKDAFGDLANFIITELLRITSQRFFAELLSLAMRIPSGGGGSAGSQAGEFTDPSDVFTRTSAGVVMRGASYAPTAANTQQQGQNNVVPGNIRIINVIDPNEVVFAMRTAEGERAIVNVIERNPSTMRRILGVS